MLLVANNELKPQDSCESAAKNSHFTYADYSACILILLSSTVIGIYHAWKARKSQATSTAEVLMGGRRMGVLPMSSSLMASFMSAITLLGNPAEMYKYGTLFIFIGIPYVVVSFITSAIYLPVYFKLHLTSAYEYLAMRFNMKVRLLGSFIFTFHMISYLPIVVYAPALALNQVTGIDTYLACSVIFIVCIFYTSIGGMRAVMWTDTLQIFIMFGSMLFVAVYGTYQIDGGFHEVVRLANESGRFELYNFSLDPLERHTVWNLVLGGTTLWMSTYAANQAQIQRYLSVPNIKMANKALIINAVGLVVLLFLCCWSGLVIYAYYHTCDPLLSKRINAADQLLPVFVMDTMHDIFSAPGIFLAGIASGALSTVSTGLSALAAITIKDYLSGCFGITISEKYGSQITTAICIVYGVICFLGIFIVAQLGSGILQIALSIHGIVGGPILGVFTLGMTMPWVDSVGALTGAISSLILVIWMALGSELSKLSGELYYEVKPTSVAGCNCNITAAPPRETTLADFPLYSVSYMWYSFIGFLMTMVVGTVVSVLFSKQDTRNLNLDLISPVTIKFLNILPKRIQQILGYPFDNCDLIQQSKINSSSISSTLDTVGTITMTETKM